MAAERVLVTGGTGFVGRRVVHALRAEELPVRVLARDPRRAEPLEAWGCEVVTGDVTDRESLERAVEGCGRVVHLVAIIVGRPAEFERTMSEGTANLLAAARAAGVERFVHMSALGVSAETKDTVPYFRAKWAAEEAVRAEGIPYAIFRPSFVFGSDGGVLPTFLRQVRLLPVVPVPGSGERRLQPIWVDDVAAFFARALATDGATGRTFDLGGPDAPTWNELYAAIGKALGKRVRLLHVPMPIVRGGALVAERLPRPPVTRDQLTMLELGDNVGDPGPAIEVFGVRPIGLADQLRRAVL